MALLVHIGDARKIRSFERSGIVPGRRQRRSGWGVYAMPVLPSYFLSHQWMRELKRRGTRVMVGVYFRVPDREAVVVGHYGAAHVAMSAVRAVRLIMEVDDARGYEIIVPRKIEPRAIHAVRDVHRVVGWRYYPGAHGKPLCGCPVCVPRGDIRSRKLREAYEASFG